MCFTGVMKKLLLLPLAFVLLACQPVTKASPVPNRVAMAGDSVIWQSMLYGGNYPGYDTEAKVYPGWRATHAQPRVIQDVAGTSTSPDVLVIEFGHNYTQLGPNEQAELFAITFAPHFATCVVWVKPHPAPHNTTVINQVRQAIDDLAAARSHTVTVDWSPIVQANPEFLNEDGVHLNVPEWYYGVPVQAPAVAFSEMVNEGISRC